VYVHVLLPRQTPAPSDVCNPHSSFVKCDVCTIGAFDVWVFLLPLLIAYGVFGVH